jgi:CheY-like chemotaxis protein
LEQILLNLAVNSQDAMPDGGLLVIDTAAVELDGANIEERSGAAAVKPGKYAMLQVSDTGLGMEKKILDHVFEPFFSTKDKSKGTGLGLAMVYGTVKQHDGYIWAYSEPGKGTTFKIYFPLLDATVQTFPQDDQAPPDTGEETILVVEDDPSIRNMTEKILSRKGYHVLTAAGGTECLEFLERLDRPVDVLLTDVIMPDMNGKELFSKVEKKFPGLKVIYMSGYTDDIIAHHGVLSGDVHFLQKPFSIQDVASKIRSVLDRPK